MEFVGIKSLIFYAFALLTVASAVLVVTVRNIVHAAFSLMITLFGVAGLYVFLQADFLAATQVIVYVGGILVLILFGVMMTSGRLQMRIQIERGQLILGGLVAILILVLLFGVIANTPQWDGIKDDGSTLEPTTRTIGEMIMQGEFLLPFEVVSILLLVALIGAALISRKEVQRRRMTLQHYLVISAVLFTLGVFAVLTRRNAISILMGIELILNSCNLNFAAFSRFMTPAEDINGQIIAIFGIVLAAAEAAVFLAIILAIYREFGTIQPDQTDTLKG